MINQTSITYRWYGALNMRPEIRINSFASKAAELAGKPMPEPTLSCRKTPQLKIAHQQGVNGLALRLLN